jgi:hypothetical protein
MNLRLSLSIAGATVALAAPAVATATPSTTTVPSAAKQCKTERTEMGRETFAATYGTNAGRSNAFGMCVSHRRAETREAKRAAHTNAAKQCQAAKTADADAFATAWGKGRNAFGTCVSQTARQKAAATVAKQVRAEVKEAKAKD